MVCGCGVQELLVKLEAEQAERLAARGVTLGGEGGAVAGEPAAAEAAVGGDKELLDLLPGGKARR
jgi:hypothetical protein